MKLILLVVLLKIVEVTALVFIPYWVGLPLSWWADGRDGRDGTIPKWSTWIDGLSLIGLSLYIGFVVIAAGSVLIPLIVPFSRYILNTNIEWATRMLG